MLPLPPRLRLAFDKRVQKYVEQDKTRREKAKAEAIAKFRELERREELVDRFNCVNMFHQSPVGRCPSCRRYM